MDDNIKNISEEDLENVPDDVSIDTLKIITEQIEKSICKIKCNDGGNGTGFFCIIPFPDKFHPLPVLMTNNHIITEDDIMKKNKIKFTVNDDKLSFEIIINYLRKVYTNKEYDVTIIEIKENDNIDMNSFLEIDDQIFKDNINDIYKGKSIYLIGYPRGGKPKYAIGLIKDINENNYDIRHLCKSNPGSSGCPIINLNNNRVIGIHKGAASKGNNWNLGTLLKEPIKYFKETNLNNEKDNNIDEITIIYEIKKENKNITNDLIEKLNKSGETVSEKKIFGENFVKNNKNKCKMIINGKEKELCSYLDNENINNEKLEIKLKGINKIIDSSYMFCGCISLISLPDILNWKVNNINNMMCMFVLCQKLTYLPDISKWNTNNVTNMNGMFAIFLSLTSLPDISKWNTNNVTNMGCMFYQCSSLTSLPDISNWNTNNVTNMNGMFDECSSLTSLPDISTWNTNIVTDMGCMFYKCSSLISLPDISKWNTNNVTNMNGMFAQCSSLTSLPGVSNWNTNKVTDKEFFGIKIKK